MKLRPVGIQFVNQAWQHAEKFIKDAEDQYKDVEYTAEQIRVYVMTGQWMLIMIMSDDDTEVVGAITVSFTNYPNDRIAHITAIGGKLITERDTYQQLSDILRANGATKLQAMVQESGARLWRPLGLEQRAILVEAKL
jgi:hypothetical protein